MGFSMKTSVWLATLIFFLATVTITEGRQPVLHNVGGGKQNWTLNGNFDEWTTHEKFYVGDWLYFGFNKTVYNVLEVNKKAYENCVAKNYITNVTRGGRDVFELKEAKTYYFICSRGGFCSDGMKVAVSVQTAPPNANSPSDLPSFTPSIAASSISHDYRVVFFLFMGFLVV